MSRIGSKHTQPELTVRKILHALGYRYRLHRKDLPGRPDISFGSRRKAIFVHGCFWHGHGCSIGREPKSNLDFWRRKLAKNRERDECNRSELEAIGWSVATIWQCEIKEIQRLERGLIDFLGPTNSIDNN
jgi:DNA mismatch endonuclease (patch repair protein)